MIDRIRITKTVTRALLGDSIGLLGESRVPMKAVVTDLDLNRHVTNSQYLKMMDMGRSDLMIRNGLARAAWDLKMGPVVGGMALRFKAEIRMGTEFEIASRIIGWDEKWFFCEQSFEVDGRARAVAVLKLLFHRGAKKATPAEVVEVHRDGPRPSPIDGPTVAVWAQENGL